MKIKIGKVAFTKLCQLMEDGESADVTLARVVTEAADREFHEAALREREAVDEAEPVGVKPAEPTFLPGDRVLIFGQRRQHSGTILGVAHEHGRDYWVLRQFTNGALRLEPGWKLTKMDSNTRPSHPCTAVRPPSPT